MDSRPPLNEQSASGRVHGLLERHGIPKHKHSPHVAALLQVSYSSAHRKLAGASPWSLDELQRLSSHFGEPLATIVDGETDAREEPLFASFTVGSVRVGCRLWIGEELPDSTTGSLVAVNTGSQWMVMAADDCDSSTRYGVERVVIEPARDAWRRIAVLDELDLAESISTDLREAGFDGVPYCSADALKADLPFQHYDGYIVDWDVGREDAGHVTASIRTHDPAAPIAVVSARGDSSPAVETEVAAALSTHQLLFFEKPLRMPIMAAAFWAALSK